MLKDQIKKDQIAALKTANQLQRTALGMLLAAIQNKELVKRTALSKTVSDTADLEIKSKLTDEEIIDVVAGEIKKRKESAEQFRVGKRPELAATEEKEIEYFAIYMPPQLSETAVSEIIRTVIKEQGATALKDMGKVIGTVMSRVRGQADGMLVSRLVKEYLQG